MLKLVCAVALLSLGACASPSGSGPSASGGAKNAGSTGTHAAPGALSSLGGLSLGGSGSSSTENRIGASLDVLKAVSVSDEELRHASLQMRAREDKRQPVAAPSSKHAQRIERLTAKHVNEDGMKLNFKVYSSPQVNANASPDGSIRIYSGLMDKLTDAELLGVIGHEVGHVKLQHSLNAMRTAYLASAGRKAAASSSGALGALADSELGNLAEAVLNAQFSQSQETDADDFAFAFMKKHGYDVRGLESAFRKLGGSGGALLSSHPSTAARAERMRQRLAGGN